ncbi:MAG: hypothetical protein H7293_00900 [Candidatus Saccharibacteria bacterium]|nr:hypothetical protein [Rhodoferax sp.]
MSKIKYGEHRALVTEGIRGETEAELKGRAVMRPALNSLLVINSFKNLVGDDIDTGVMLEALQNSMREVKNGDLASLEAMLLGQATALQSMFTSLVIRATGQERLGNYQAYMGLALKAQNQSRATISALVDLKYPRQATFVKQANIAHGPQQVNNGTAAGADPEQYAQARSHAEKSTPEQNKLLEADHEQPGKRMDTRAAQTAKRGNSAVETVATINRTKKSRR